MMFRKTPIAVAALALFAAPPLGSQTASVTIEADGPDACILTAGADDPERMVFYLALPGCEFEVLEPPEVVQAVGMLAERLRRAAG